MQLQVKRSEIQTHVSKQVYLNSVQQMRNLMEDKMQSFIFNNCQKGEGADPALPRLFYENPTSRFLSNRFPMSRTQFWQIPLPRNIQIPNPTLIFSKIPEPEITSFNIAAAARLAL